MFRKNMSNKPLSVLPHQKKKNKTRKQQQQKKKQDFMRHLFQHLFIVLK